MLHWLWAFAGSNLMQQAVGIAGSATLQPRHQHQYRMIEGDAQLRRQLQEQEASHRYRLIEGEAALRRQILDQQVANEIRKGFEVWHQELANKAADRAAERTVETQQEIDLNRRFADNNPFFDPIGYVQRSLFQRYNQEQKSIIPLKNSSGSPC